MPYYKKSTYAHKIVPRLSQAMQMAEAGNLTLSEAAGCDPGTIQRARRGFGVRPYIADAIMQALCTKEFEFRKPGKKAVI